MTRRSPTVAYLEGIACWTPALPDWDTARAVLQGNQRVSASNARLPVTEFLAAKERRRSPDTVVLALHVASRAVHMSGLDPRRLKGVFASAHGDLSVTHDICRTLARAAEQTSPTKFHHSVHNAASGYWGVATGCQKASTALSAADHTFGTGMLEALCQCAADEQPVLMVGYDVEATGPLASLNASRGMLAIALVLAPRRSARTLASMHWDLANASAPSLKLLRVVDELGLSCNAMAGGLPFLDMLSRGVPTELYLPLSRRTAVRIVLPEGAFERVDSWQEMGVPG